DPKLHSANRGAHHCLRLGKGCRATAPGDVTAASHAIRARCASRRCPSSAAADSGFSTAKAGTLKVRGVILQASYRVLSRPGTPRRAVVHLFGRLLQGGSFLIRDDRCRPRFFIRSIDATRATALLNRSLTQVAPRRLRQVAPGPMPVDPGFAAVEPS